MFSCTVVQSVTQCFHKSCEVHSLITIYYFHLTGEEVEAQRGWAWVSIDMHEYTWNIAEILASFLDTKFSYFCPHLYRFVFLFSISLCMSFLISSILALSSHWTHLFGPYALHLSFCITYRQALCSHLAHKNNFKLWSSFQATVASKWF